MKYHETFTKDPDAVLDYAIPWGKWLTPGDSIASATWTVGGGITQAPKVTDTTPDGTVTIWVAGGTVGTLGTARCRVTTVEGRVDDRTIAFQITER